jgi:hypothetical protein
MAFSNRNGCILVYGAGVDKRHALIGLMQLRAPRL